MVDSIYKWSMTAASNDAADSIINWRENQLPDTVNDSARSMMKRVAEFREDLTGGIITTGSQPIYSLTTNAAFDTLTNGRWFTARVHATNTGPASLNVNLLGAKNIRKFGVTGDLPLGVGDLQLGGLYQFMYSATADGGAGGWVISNPSIATGGGFASGTKMLFVQAAAPTGWTLDTTHNDKALRLSNTAGGVAGGSFTFSSVFASRTPIGTNTAIALTAAQLPAHTHAVGTYDVGNDTPDHTHGPGTLAMASQNANHQHALGNGTHSFVGWGGSGGSFIGTTSSGGQNLYGVSAATASQNANHQHDINTGATGGASVRHSHPLTGASGSIGSGSTHNHTWTGTAMDFAVQYVDAIICTKD